MKKVYCDYCGRQAEYVDSKVIYGESGGIFSRPSAPVDYGIPPVTDQFAELTDDDGDLPF